MTENKEESIDMKQLMIGAHVGIAKGVSNSILRISEINGTAFALFLKNQKRWTGPQFSPEEITKFKDLAKENNLDTTKCCLPHGSYLINLANPDPAKRENSYKCFLDDLNRCEQLDIGLYNFHPGSTLGTDKSEAIKHLSSNINKAISSTTKVKIVIENMAGKGNVLGSKLEEIAEMISLVKDKSRIGVCVDTCHTFSAGYDLRTEDNQKQFWESFDKIIGLKYLAAIHVNDSKTPFGANADLHQNIGLGFLGLEAFRALVNTSFIQKIPLILETPMDDEINDSEITRKGEIELLNWMIGKSKDDKEIIEKRDHLSKLGEDDRKKREATYLSKSAKKVSTLDSFVVKKKRKTSKGTYSPIKGEVE